MEKRRKSEKTAPKFAWEVTEEDKADYLDAISEGLPPNLAAKQIGTTGSVMRKFRSEQSQWFDRAFAEGYREAITSEAHAQNRLEMLRDAFWDLVEQGNTRAIEKGLLVYDPDWQVLRHQNFNVDVKVLARYVPYFSQDELESIIARAENAVERGEALELDAAVEEVT